LRISRELTFALTNSVANSFIGWFPASATVIVYATLALLWCWLFIFRVVGLQPGELPGDIFLFWMTKLFFWVANPFIDSLRLPFLAVFSTLSFFFLLLPSSTEDLVRFGSPWFVPL
jgi:hypothetical protein